MNDERYVGTVRGIIDKKRAATDYAESMIPHFDDARAKGSGANLTKYAYWFDGLKLTTPNGKQRWHPTQVSNLMKLDEILTAKREDEIKNFNKSVTFFRSWRYTGERKVSDQLWDDLRTEYMTFLDDNIVRAKAIAARING